MPEINVHQFIHLCTAQTSSGDCAAGLEEVRRVAAVCGVVFN